MVKRPHLATYFSTPRTVPAPKLPEGKVFLVTGDCELTVRLTKVVQIEKL